MASENFKKAEDFAQESGGAKTAEASEMRSTSAGSDKMENELEMKKANKQSIDKAEDVAGRENKGTGTKILEKITGDPKNK